MAGWVRKLYLEIATLLLFRIYVKKSNKYRMRTLYNGFWLWSKLIRKSLLLEIMIFCKLLIEYDIKIYCLKIKINKICKIRLVVGFHKILCCKKPAFQKILYKRIYLNWMWCLNTSVGSVYKRIPIQNDFFPSNQILFRRGKHPAEKSRDRNRKYYHTRFYNMTTQILSFLIWEKTLCIW